MTVSMVSEIDSSRARPGDSFEGTLVEDLVSEGRLVAAKGSRAYGKVVASSAGPTASLLSLKLTELTVGGRVVSSSTDVVRYGTGASLAPKPGNAAQLQANLGAAMEGGQGGTTASAPAVERVVLAAGTPVQFRLASTLIVGVTAD